jgi:predicted phosphoadenosine phosphosulfate sulfurtransferase
MSSRPTALRRLEQAWFEAPIDNFIGMSEAEIIGQLTIKSFHSVDIPQTEAWRVEIGVLKQALPTKVQSHRTKCISVAHFERRNGDIAGSDSLNRNSSQSSS